MKNVFIGFCVLVCLLCVNRWWKVAKNPEKYGIHTVGTNVVILDGESITINWNAEPREVEKALDLWWKLRKEEVK